MKHSIRQHVALVILLTTLNVRVKAMSKDENSDKVLASEQMQDGSTLALYRRDVGRPSANSRLRYSLHTKPTAGADTDTVFYLSYRPPHSATVRIVWVAYRMVHVLLPSPQFAAALIEDANDHPLLIFVESGVLKTSYSIYEIDLAKRLAGGPPHLDPEQKEEWPDPTQPLSSISFEPTGNDKFNACFVNGIDAKWQGSALTLQAHQNSPRCESLFVTFDPSSLKWSDLRRVKTEK